MKKAFAEEIRTDLTKIMNEPRYSFTVQLLVYALISGSFTVFFGGDWKDMIVSAAIAILLKYMETYIKKSLLTD